MECRVCHQDFIPTDHQMRKSDWICNPCRRQNDREWRLRRKAAGLPVVSTRMSREWHREYEKHYFANPENRRRRAKLMADYRNDPRLAYRHAARVATRNAINRGDLIKQPCANCGDIKVQAHHEDYSKPFDVIWLCRKCHLQHHAKAEGGDNV